MDRIFLFFIISVASIGCLNNQKGVVENNSIVLSDRTQNKNDTGEEKSISPDYCKDLVQKLVFSSSIDTNRISGFNLVINEISKKVLTINFSKVNDENSIVPIVWLQVDLSKRELRDITNDIEEPEFLQTDERVFDELINNCIWSDTED